MKFTKIVATVSDRDCSSQFIRDLADRGMDVVRLNTAHMGPEKLEKIVQTVRSVSQELAIMVDTKGPNIRTCGIASPLELKKGDRLFLSGVPDGKSVCVNYGPFADEVPVGCRIVCDDGACVFDVIGREETRLEIQARFDCTLQDRKSINVPDIPLKAPALTDKDRLFLRESVRLGIDFVAHSFVRSAADIAAVREELGEAGRGIAIIAKIENREGVANIDEILEAADGIMVARGDLGIEIPLEEVPGIQKVLIRKAMENAKPVITATQMLQSMENAPSPTRAEVSDVANAVYDGTDAVMLSGETAHGKFPREAVEMMNRIVTQAESAPGHFFTKLEEVPEEARRTAYIINAALGSCDYLPVKAIVCTTLSGISARVCAATRKRVPVVAATPKENILRQLSLSYGVFPFLSTYSDDPFEQAEAALRCTCNRLKDTDLVMLLVKNSTAAERNNTCCLAMVKEFMRIRNSGKDEQAEPGKQ